MSDKDKKGLYARRKPMKCPECGAHKIVRIIYGEPTPEAMKLVETGKAVLGGCCILIDGPIWECIACMTQIYKSAKLHDIDDDLPF